MAKVTRIGILGDFNQENPTHLATNDGIAHAAEALHLPFESVWLPTDQPHAYSDFDGIFCSPGSPYRSLDGALGGIRYAREHRLPFLGTCGGMQHLVLEYARNVMGITDAAHAETDPYASRLFVTPLSCSLVGKTMEVVLKPGSRATAIFQATHTQEAYYCNFGLNPRYLPELEAAGLSLSGFDQDGEARIVELPAHPFFMGTLFVPQARSAPGKPHPVVLAFCQASASQS